MVASVSFRGSETTGGVGDRKIETAKQETTGGVGMRNNPDSVFTADNELKQDTVCFRGGMYDGSEKKKTSAAGAALYTAAGAAVVVGLLGLAHKYDVIGKYVKNEKVKNFLHHTDVVTENCHKACKWVKNNSYDKIAAFFSKKK